VGVIEVATMADPNGEPGLDALSARPQAAEAKERVRLDFDEVFAREQAALIALAFGLTGSRGLAEDLTQEAFLRLHQRWGRVAAYEQPGAWLRRVLLNLARSRARRLAVEARALARFGRQHRPDPFLSTESAEFWSAIRTLPRRQAEVLALYYLDDRPVAEVAEILRLAEGTVRAHLHSGRAALRARLVLDEEPSP
jgi:RNA polymerase sigma-70 factor (ECF subfamily)